MDKNSYLSKGMARRAKRAENRARYAAKHQEHLRAYAKWYYHNVRKFNTAERDRYVAQNRAARAAKKAAQEARQEERRIRYAEKYPGRAAQAEARRASKSARREAARKRHKQQTLLKWRMKNREKILAYGREYMRKRYATPEGRAKILSDNEKWRRANPEKFHESMRQSAQRRRARFL